MKYIDAEKLKAEIERRKQVHFDDYFIKKSGNPADYGASNALAQVLSFIDSLQKEQSGLPGIEENLVPGKDYIPVDWVETCEEYGKWKIVKLEQGADLEEEIDKVWNNGLSDELAGPHNNFNICARLARHFYELGESNARKEVTK